MASIEQLVKQQVDRWQLLSRASSVEPDAPRKATPRPFVTVSRERGAGGAEIARALGDRLGWHVLDRDLADYVAEDAHVRRQIMSTVDEHVHGRIETYLNSLLMGKYPDEVDYARHLGRALHVYLLHDPAVIVGRGSNILLRDVSEYGLHIRVIAPLPWRVRHLAETEGLSENAAREEIRRADEERARFVHSAFGRDIADPLLYDLLLRRDTLGADGIADIVLASLSAKGLAVPTPRGQSAK